jgi:DNA mismatch endonuclease (patch repair protein)
MLFASGLRYRVHKKPLPYFRREADIVLKRFKIAIFVDGCFWHGCPIHKSEPKIHREWWEQKITANVIRDGDTTSTLSKQGWKVVRIWEHEDPQEAVAKVLRLVNRAKRFDQSKRSVMKLGM